MRQMTLAEFFDEFPFFQGKMAKRCHISEGVFRSYVAGMKTPSPERLERINKEIQIIAKELQIIKLSIKPKPCKPKEDPINVLLLKARSFSEGAWVKVEDLQEWYKTLKTKKDD